MAILAAIRRTSSRVSRLVSMAFVVFLIGGDPVLRDSFLRGSEIELPTADHVAHLALWITLLVEIFFRRRSRIVC